jgi:isoquinoline 1-oxidoreductase beta subunit
MSTRRRFLLGTLGATGALVVGWSVLPPRQRLTTAEPLPASGTQVPLNGWLKIDADGNVIVALAKSEMGQGVATSLAMLVAEELDADWQRVRTEASPIDKIYYNQAGVVDSLPIHPDNHGTLVRLAGWLTAKTMREIGVMMTGGSSSMKDLWAPMREAGASARLMLVRTAAAKWNVPPETCTVAAGVVSHGASGRSLGFGALAAEAAKQPFPKDVPLKAPAQYRLIGKPQHRLDTKSKLDGSARFGIDANPPGMLYASVVMCPALGGTVGAFDAAAAKALPGVKDVFAIDGHAGGTAGVAAVADTPWHAMKAAQAVTVTWKDGPAAAWSSADVGKRLRDELDHETGFGYYKTGDVEGAIKGAAQVIEAEYEAPYLAHAAMEPMNCTALVKADVATFWVSTQVPDIARGVAAKVLGLDAVKVEVKVPFLGGGFGRRLDVDFIGQAAEIAKKLPGTPVQTIWSREQDMTHDFYRPGAVARYKAGLDATGAVVGWQATSAGQAIVPKALARAFGLPGAGPDKTTAEGAFDQPYEWPNARVGHSIVDLPLPIGFWRSVGHSHQAFFIESFLDEAAHAAGQDPVAYRAALLKNHPLHLAVLKRAAEKSGWGTPLEPAADGAKKARGIALHQSFGSTVAEVAEVSIGPDKRIRVHRVVCVVDCGIAVNPDGIRQQMEGGVVFGLGAALYGGITFEKGRVLQTNFHDQPSLRISECPVVEVEIMPSTEGPEGVGEPGVPPIAPAVANAVFALTGQRLRKLPLTLA